MKNVINKYIELDNDVIQLHIIKTTGEEIDTFFDRIDFDLIKSIHWSFRYDNKNGAPRIRATTTENRGKDMSTILFNNNINTNLMVDHINRDTLDNTRKNLRLVSRSINATNARPRTESTTNIRGVYFREERSGIAKASWICEWSVEKKRHTKSFSIAKYGYDKAFELACQYRENKLKEMKI